MFGEPQDINGECNAVLFVADNYGDGCATIRCTLTPEHVGMHREQFERDGGTVTITWAADERVKCDHGCGQWVHDHRENCVKDADSHANSDCAYCNPDEPALTCAACGAVYYYETGHKRHCPKEPFSCETCGESGVGPHAWPFGCPRIKTVEETANPRSDEVIPTLDVSLVEILPHPDQSTTHPGWWKVKLAASYDASARTFWRWHKAPNEKTPRADEILAWFWGTTFIELYGFSFDEEPTDAMVGGIESRVHSRR